MGVRSRVRTATGGALAAAIVALVGVSIVASSAMLGATTVAAPSMTPVATRIATSTPSAASFQGAADPRTAPGYSEGPQARERAKGDQALERLTRMSDADLTKLFESTKPERRLMYRDFDVALGNAFRRALSQGTESQRMEVARALRAALGEMATATPADLARRVTENGAANPVNLDMRDATLHLAMLARITSDRAMADRAAALLARFAEVMPRWPVWNPYHEEMPKRRSMRQDDPETFKSEYSAGLWGWWIYSDLLLGLPLVQAHSIIEPMGAIDRVGPGARESIRRMFDLHIETQRKYNPGGDFSNQDAFQIRGLMEFGRLLGEPELVHEGVRRFEEMYHAVFYPDGWWQEGSVSYHSDLQAGLREIAQEMLKDYSDPPGFKSTVDGTRFDHLDLAERVRAPAERAERVLERTVLPDGNHLAMHDTPWPWPARPGSRPPFRSHLFGALGHGSLISGAGDGTAMAIMNWSPTGAHAHLDALSLVYWAKGTEAISETQYHPIKGSNSTREWHTSTAGHVTVVVDGVNQSARGKNGERRRKPQPEDAIEGTGDWRWRWGQQAAHDGGALRLFSTLVPEVQVMEADAPRAYDMVTDVSMYRRTVALVRIDDDDSYLVDVFRVKGGSTYDYMLHSSLQLAQSVRLSLPVQPVSGTAHGVLEDLRSAKTDGPWLAAFRMENDVTLVSFMAPAPGTEVIQAQGPAMRRVGDAPFVIARRRGPETVYVAVHHVMRGSTPRVQGIEIIPNECKGCVAFKVKIGDRTDTVIACEDRTKKVVLPGGIEMRGLFAHVAGGATPDQQWALLVDGDLLKTPTATIEGETSWWGTVRATMRMEAGDEVDGFVVDEAIPEGSSIWGTTIIVDQAGEMTWAYDAAKVSKRDGHTVIETPNEPGFFIEPGAINVIKQTYFPNWGFKGEAKYRVPGEAMARPPNAGVNDPPPTGSAKASWK